MNASAREGCIDAKEREKLRKRLRRIEGQVRGLARMVERDAPCAEILTQIASVRAAAEKAAVLIIKDHIEHHVRKPVKDGVQAEQKADELVSAIESFLRV